LCTPQEEVLKVVKITTEGMLGMRKTYAAPRLLDWDQDQLNALTTSQINSNPEV
jgi:hypothetical protein